MVKVAKKLKKEKVNVDIVSFGEHEVNNEKLDTFIKTLNGKDGGRFWLFDSFVKVNMLKFFISTNKFKKVHVLLKSYNIPVVLKNSFIAL